MSLLDYAANINNSPKTYGSIDLGVEIINYRRERKEYWKTQGFNYVETLKLAENDILKKYGEKQ